MFENLPTYLNVLTYQCLWIPEPPMSEKNVPDLGGKVLLVTGGDTGIGYHLCRILYSKHGSVYLASHNVKRGEAAIKRIKAAYPASLGRIHGLYLDLEDLASIKASVKAFTDRESRLDVLWNNADVMTPLVGSKTKQGHEMQLGTNCLGPYLLTELLKPLLQKTAAIAPLYTVRVLWAGAASIVFFAPTGGVQMDAGTGNGKDAKPVPQWSQIQNYAQSKAGNLFLADGFAKEVVGSGIVSVCFNPGSCFTESGWHMSGSELLQRLILYPAEKGAYAELYCGLSPELTAWHNGKYFAPWGCLSRTRKDIDEGLGSGESDGKNNAGKGDAGKTVAGQKGALIRLHQGTVAAQQHVDIMAFMGFRIFNIRTPGMPSLHVSFVWNAAPSDTQHSSYGELGHAADADPRQIAMLSLSCRRGTARVAHRCGSTTEAAPWSLPVGKGSALVT